VEQGFLPNFTPMKRLRILHTVESYYPEVHGMAEVVRRLSTALAEFGHEVHVAARVHPQRNDGLYDSVYVHGFDVAGSIVWGIDGSEAEKYRRFVIEGGFDIVTCFAAQQWATDLLLDVLEEIPSKKVHVPTGFSGLFRPEFSAYFDKMKQWVHGFNAHIVLSDSYRDTVFLKNAGIQNCFLIPNGASEKEFSASTVLDVRKELDIPAHHKLLLHVGGFTHHKGHKELLQIMDCLQSKHVTLLMVCNNAAELKKYFSFRLGSVKAFWMRLFHRKNILVRTLNRQQTVDAFKQADVFVFPSNIECSPIVLFESMAAKLPFVSSEAGNAAEIIHWSKGGMLLPGVADKNGYTKVHIRKSAEIIDSLLTDTTLRRHLAASGYAAWSERFTWEAIAKQYEKVYESLVNS
jgi:glycosyltransferase involved in cell wall biosynthesis